MRSLFEIACKRCNSKDGNSAFEAVVVELRATLLRRSGGVARVRIPHHCQRPDPPKRRLIQPQQAFFTVFHPMGLHFGGHTTANHARAAANRGELHYTSFTWPSHRTSPGRQSGGIALHGGSTRRRHAARGLRVVQNPHRSQPQVRRVASKTGAGPLGAK